MNDYSNLKISSRLIAEAAEKRGWKISIIQSPESFFILTDLKGRRHLMCSTTPGLASAAGLMLTEDKLIFANYLKFLGISQPDFISSKASEEELVDFMDKHGSVVVKPIDTAHGDGITIGVESRQELEVAIDKVRKVSKAKGIIIQEQREGEDYRLTVVNGRLVAATYRRPAMVVGDGSSTIEELIIEKNSDPERQAAYTSKRSLIDFDEVIEEGLVDILAVPDKDDVIFLTKIANSSKGGDSVDITDELHPGLAGLAIEAAKACRLFVAGVDIMATDYRLPVNESGAIVLEVNTPPGIRLHHFPGEGESRDVAGMILDALDERAVGDS